MKKSILLFAVALGMLTACDPIKEDGSMKIDSFTSSTLLDGAEFSQYADQACSTPQADGNWIKYNVPKATSVYIYYVTALSSSSPAVLQAVCSTSFPPVVQIPTRRFISVLSMPMEMKSLQARSLLFRWLPS